MPDYLYSIAETDLDQAQILIEKATGVRLELRDSFYHGGDYLSWSSDDDSTLELIVQHNLDGEEIAEEDFPEAKILVIVSGDEEAAEAVRKMSTLLRGVPGIDLLRFKDP